MPCTAVYKVILYTVIELRTMVVHHFGPETPATVVVWLVLSSCATQNITLGGIVYAHPTWRPGSPLQTARLVATAARELLRMPRAKWHTYTSPSGGHSCVRDGSWYGTLRGLVTVATIHGA